MEEKANNKKKKLLTVVLVFAVVLAVTATTWCPFSPPHKPSVPATPRPPDPPGPISCSEQTPHYSSGCELLLHYDADNNGIISYEEQRQADDDLKAGEITNKEYSFVFRTYVYWLGGAINVMCPGCYSPP